MKITSVLPILKIVALGAISLFMAVLWQCNRANKKEEAQNKTPTQSAFIGDASCNSCHSKEVSEWKGSHHDWAMKIATSETVLGDFNRYEEELDGVQYLFRKQDDSYWVDATEIDGQNASYEIIYTFGVAPLQQYIVLAEKGRYQVLRASWDSEKKKWFHQYPNQRLSPNDWLHWTNGGQRWNTMCADCHSTNLKRNYFAQTDSFYTTYSTINVSCESCHGPARKHLEWATAGQKEQESLYQFAGRNQTAQVNMCGPCHARRTRLTENQTVGIEFANQYLIQNISPDFYHADGQIKEEDYVLGSFMQSKMYHNEVKCTDCHNPHSMKLKKDGNALCMQCHEPKYDTPSHHFHESNTESAQCVSCHMTGETYMGNDFRRDHSFRVPRPDQSVLYGTPNACTGCHTNKSATWAANKVNVWYGENRQPHFSDNLLLSTKQNLSDSEKSSIYAFIANTNYPEIARATALENITFSLTETDIRGVLAALDDVSPLVRREALTKLMTSAQEERLEFALLKIKDPSRIVRIMAAQLIADVDPSAIPSQNRTDVNRATSELETMLYSNLDFPVGRMQMGYYLTQKKRFSEALIQYKKAISMDSLLPDAYAQAATVYNTIGKNDSALAFLDACIHTNPENARAFYLRALLLVEIGDEESAIKDFEHAINFDETNFRAYYNLATLHYQRKKWNDAELVINKGLKIYPENRDGKYLLALIYKEKGLLTNYNRLMQELNEMN